MDACKEIKVEPEANLGRQFLYVRYDADLSADGLKDLGFPHVDAANIQELDAVGNISILTEIGQAAAQPVEPAHFGLFL